MLLFPYLSPSLPSPRVHKSILYSSLPFIYSSYICISIRYFGEGNGNPLQCSHLENPMDSGAWWAIVHGLAKSQTWRKQLSTHACTGPLLLAYFLSFSPFIPIPAILRSKHIISLLLPILHTTRERLLFLEWEQRLFCRAQQRTGRVISLTGNIKLPTIVLLLL